MVEFSPGLVACLRSAIMREGLRRMGTKPRASAWYNVREGTRRKEHQCLIIEYCLMLSESHKNAAHIYQICKWHTVGNQPTEAGRLGFKLQLCNKKTILCIKLSWKDIYSSLLYLYLSLYMSLSLSHIHKICIVYLNM